ncbi:MAG: NYN domain-containing protein [Candidatus Diapherotrites archaeon]|nr:NYN domain-containing protein [Candidatus Diapherotrites archaeon]
MALKKAHLFIDGSNTYHALKENKLFDLFSYKWLYGEISKHYEIQKVFYYDATKSFKIEQRQFAEQQRFHSKLTKEIPNLVIRARKLKYLTKNSKIESAKKKAGFCNGCLPKIESFLKLSGLRKISKEKGIDIMLVCDMIKGAFQNKYETALLLSGDADYTPAVELAQLLGKETVNVHCYAGSAAELRNTSDLHLLITSDAKGSCLLKKY